MPKQVFTRSSHRLCFSGPWPWISAASTTAISRIFTILSLTHEQRSAALSPISSAPAASNEEQRTKNKEQRTLKILVTGCAGFIGARTTELLLEAGHEATGIDNLNDYYDVRLKEYRLNRLLPLEGFRFEKVDVEDAEALGRVMRTGQFQAVIHLAARAGVRASIENPRAYLRTNVEGTLNLLQCMVQHNVDRLVVASTSALYAGTPLPFVETADVRKPISPYAVTKLAAETLAYTWHHLYGLNVAVLRYFTVYGPGGRPDMSPFRFIERIRTGQEIVVFGSGAQRRDFTHIDDIALGTIAALGVDGCEVFNLGAGADPVQLHELISSIEEELKLKASIRYESRQNTDMEATSANIDKAKAILKWMPSVSFTSGIRSTAAWHLRESQFLESLSL